MIEADRASTLLTVIALARAGASRRARERFRKAGLDRVQDDPKVLTLKGRLLKDQALQRTGSERIRLFADAAAAYQAAADLQPSSYALINTATLWLLAKQPDRARAGAEATLKLISSHPDEPETPYFRAATQAEALLLLGRPQQSRQILHDALSEAPRAWEDHASTIRQFRAILAETGQETGWLAFLSPPTALHFGGHMSFDPDASHAMLRDQVDEALERERVGFGFGALAAGADIIIAEALLARGAEVHLILPGGSRTFSARSVDPFGPTWRDRFDAVLASAESVRPVRPLGVEPSPPMIRVADEIAMGAALMTARHLETAAAQLLVVPADGLDEGQATARARETWSRTGKSQILIKAPRQSSVLSSSDETDERPGLRALAIVAVTLGASPKDTFALDAELRLLKGVLATLAPPSLAPFWTGRHCILAFDRVDSAADVATALGRRDMRVGAHYGAAMLLDDPFSGEPRVGPDVIEVAAAASAFAGTVYVTEDFGAAAAALAPGLPPSELVGEMEPPDDGPPVALYALSQA